MQQNKGIHRMRQQPRGVGSMCNSVARYICNLVSRIPNLYAGIGRAVARYASLRSQQKINSTSNSMLTSRSHLNE